MKGLFKRTDCRELGIWVSLSTSVEKHNSKKRLDLACGEGGNYAAVHNCERQKGEKKGESKSFPT